MVSEGDNFEDIPNVADDDGIREPPHHQPSNSYCCERRRDSGKWHDIVLEKLERIVDRLLELLSEARSFTFIVRGCFRRLFRSFTQDPDLTHQIALKRLWMRSLSSSGVTKVAPPSSICWMRRKISASHCSAAPGSADPSRLAIKALASSARSASDSDSASSLVESKAWLDISSNHSRHLQLNPYCTSHNHGMEFVRPAHRTVKPLRGSTAAHAERYRAGISSAYLAG